MFSHTLTLHCTQLPLRQAPDTGPPLKHGLVLVLCSWCSPSRLSTRPSPWSPNKEDPPAYPRNILGLTESNLPRVLENDLQLSTLGCKDNGPDDLYMRGNCRQVWSEGADSNKDCRRPHVSALCPDGRSFLNSLNYLPSTSSLNRVELEPRLEGLFGVWDFDGYTNRAVVTKITRISPRNSFLEEASWCHR